MVPQSTAGASGADPWGPVRLWFLRLMLPAVAIGFAYGIGYGIWRLPAATIPALLATVIAAVRGTVVDGVRDRDSDAAFHRVVAWGIGGGGLGYSVLAAFSIGLLADGLGLAWRIFGGAVVGASVGIFVACAVNILRPAIPATYWLWLPRQ